MLHLLGRYSIVKIKKTLTHTSTIWQKIHNMRNIKQLTGKGKCKKGILLQRVQF